MYLLLPIVCGYLDRIRGGGLKEVNPYLPTIGFMFYGGVVGAALGLVGWQLAIFTILFMVGEQLVGWTPLYNQIFWGKKLTREEAKWYQAGEIINHPYLAAVLRGLLWGVPTLVFFPEGLVFTITMAIAFPMGLFLANTYCDDHTEWNLLCCKTRWHKSQVIRGVIVGGLVMFLGLC